MKTMGTKHRPASRLAKATILLILSYACQVVAEPVLNGVATHAELGKEQFISGLYTTTPTDSSITILTSNEPKQLEVRVLAKQLSSRRFKRMWIEGMAINASPSELEKHAQNMAMFSNMLKIKLLAGDIFKVDRSLDSVTVLVNDVILGQIADPAFFDLLLRTWIGPVPLSSDFRKDLLSKGEIKPGPLTRYQATRPSAQRVALISNAMAAKRAAEAEAADVAEIPQPSIQAPSAPVQAPSEQVAQIERTPRQTPTPTPKQTPPQTVTRVAAASPKPSPKPASVATKPSPKPQPKARTVALAPMEEELDESIFDDAEDVEFTAESLLKEQLYYSRLAKYTHRFLTYPQKAWDRGREGNVRLKVTIDRGGNVINSEILEESKYKSLNKEARKAITRANPYPSMPEDVQGDDYTFIVRVAFKIVDSY